MDLELISIPFKVLWRIDAQNTQRSIFLLLEFYELNTGSDIVRAKRQGTTPSETVSIQSRLQARGGGVSIDLKMV